MRDALIRKVEKQYSSAFNLKMETEMAEIIEFQPRVREGQRHNTGKGATVLPWRRSDAKAQPPADENAGLTRLIDPPLKGAEE